jgi:hypothetical protein
MVSIRVITKNLADSLEDAMIAGRDNLDRSTLALCYEAWVHRSVKALRSIFVYE